MPMRRRAPPTSLRLVPGPAPARNTPKHTLPSVPRPTFHPPTKQTIFARNCSTMPCLDIAGSAPLPLPVARKIVRGPWDHSGSIPITFDVENVLAPLKPVAVSL